MYAFETNNRTAEWSQGRLMLCGGNSINFVETRKFSLFFFMVQKSEKVIYVRTRKGWKIHSSLASQKWLHVEEYCIAKYPVYKDKPTKEESQFKAILWSDTNAWTINVWEKHPYILHLSFSVKIGIPSDFLKNKKPGGGTIILHPE